MIRLEFLIFVIAMSGGLLASTVGAQIPAPPFTPGPGTVRAVLGSTPLASVADAPRYFKLVRVHLPATQAATYNGPVGFVLVLEGALEVTSGADQRSVAKSDGVLVAKDKSTIFKSAPGKPAEFLHFVLATAGELNAPMESPPAVVKELYRTASAIPGLKPGPYELRWCVWHSHRASRSIRRIIARVLRSTTYFQAPACSRPMARRSRGLPA